MAATINVLEPTRSDAERALKILHQMQSVGGRKFVRTDDVRAMMLAIAALEAWALDGATK